MSKTFEQYLLDGVNQKTPTEGVVDGYVNIIDHSLRVDATGFGGHPMFYIHPANQDGETLDFIVVGNSLIPISGKSADEIRMKVAAVAVIDWDKMTREEAVDLAQHLIRARDNEKARVANLAEQLSKATQG